MSHTVTGTLDGHLAQEHRELQKKGYRMAMGVSIIVSVRACFFTYVLQKNLCQFVARRDQTASLDEEMLCKWGLFGRALIFSLQHVNHFQ